VVGMEAVGAVVLTAEVGVVPTPAAPVVASTVEATVAALPAATTALTVATADAAPMAACAANLRWDAAPARTGAGLGKVAATPALTRRAGIPLGDRPAVGAWSAIEAPRAIGATARSPEDQALAAADSILRLLTAGGTDLAPPMPRDRRWHPEHVPQAVPL